MKIHLFSSSLVLGKITLAGLIFALSVGWGLGPSSGAELFIRFLWAGVLSNLVFCALVFYWARRETRISLQFDAAYWHHTWRTSLPYGLALVLQTLYLRADLILISVLLGSSAVGLYGVAARVLESFLVLGVFFGQALLPKLATHENHQIESDKTLSWGLEKAALFGLPIVIGVWHYSAEIITLLSSPDYLGAATQTGADQVLLILVPTVLLAFMNQIFTFALVSKNQQKKLLSVNAAALGLNVILNLWLLPIYGIMAAAATTILAELLVFSLMIRLIAQHFTWRPQWQPWFIIIAANLGLIAGLQAPWLQQNFLEAVALSISFYGLIIFRFRKKLFA